MVDTKRIRAQMILEGYSVKSLAKEMGISTQTMSAKLNGKAGGMTMDEAGKVASILNIKNPGEIFFA